LKVSSSLLSSKADDDQIELDEHINKEEDQQTVNSKLIQRHQSETGEPLNIKSKKKRKLFGHNFGNKFRLYRMSKFKNFSYLVVLVVAVLVTFGITKYTNQTEKCIKEKESIHQHSPKNATKVYRLPNTIQPNNYDIKLQTFMRPDQFYFNGTVLISVNCKQSTDTIQLNANELDMKFDQITVSQANGQALNLSSQPDFKNEVLTLKLDTNLNVNENYTIFIPFIGNLTTSLAGFYRSSYKNIQTGETNYLAMTQFQATDARRAFPCFDEPSFKATFEIEITHWKNQTAIANMPNITNDIINSDWKRTKFDKTVRMSTYLVAWAVGDFLFKEDFNSMPRYRIVTRPSEIESASQAIQIGPKVLSSFAEYFDVPFPLPKIDMLACPDFSAGAMENWGLITYREAYLLYDKRVGSVAQLYRIASVIAHELAHQWFGNLVTMHWWQDLWLNEGFATYMSYVGVDNVRPEWKIWNRFVIDELHDVLGLDSLKNSHPISQEVNDPNEISELFDQISYSKGASIIRMMTYIIGKEVFKQGIHNYLTALKYKNADQSDLWRYLQEASDKYNNGNRIVEVQKVMDSWTLKEGYPLVTVTRDYNSNKVRFSQKRFLMNSHDKNDELIRTQYEVPITYTSKTEQNWIPTTRFWLHKNESGESFVEQEIKLSDDDWLIANVEETGYYRVTYDKQNWELLVKQLNEDPSKINAINRAQILDDLFHLAENGVVKYDLALRALEYLKKEKDPLGWTTVGSLTSMINRMLRRTESYGRWQKYMRHLILPGYHRFNLTDLNNENLLDNQMQKVTVAIACNYNLEECVEGSKKMFTEFMNNVRSNKTDKNNIPPNIRPTVYCTAIEHGGEAEWDFVFSLYLKEQSANERSALLNSLTCSRIPWILSRYLRMMFNEASGIKTQDALFTFKGVAGQNYGFDLAFNFLRENWEKIHSILGKSMSFSSIVRSLDSINSEFELKLVKDFFYRTIGNRVGSAKRAFMQTIEQIESNIKWMEVNEFEIAEFLKNFDKNRI